MERACEQALQLWQAKRATRTRALLIPASPFACDSRVTSRDSPQMESSLAGYNRAHNRHNPQSTQSHSKLAFRDSQSLQMENSSRTISTPAGQQVFASGTTWLCTAVPNRPPIWVQRRIKIAQNRRSISWRLLNRAHSPQHP